MGLKHLKAKNRPQRLRKRSLPQPRRKMLQTDEQETRQRPPKNQQNWRAALIEPYLRIANLFPLERKFPPLPPSIHAGSKVAQAVIEFAEACRHRKVWERLAAQVPDENRVTIKLHPAGLAFGPMTTMAFDEEGRLKAGSDLELFRDPYELFLGVRQMLRATQWMKTAGGRGASSLDRLPFVNAYLFSLDHRTGRYSVKPWPVFEGFTTALNDLEDDRLRRCPVCQGFFYAIRANTQACEAHRVLARVRKIRGILPATPGRTVRKAAKAKGRSSIIAATPEQGTAPVVRKPKVTKSTILRS